MPRAARLLFSGAQLHGPMPHDEPETRFSVDLRVVHRVDQRRGRGAPQVDDRSRGDVGGRRVANGGRQARLRQPGHRRLRDDQHRNGQLPRQEITRQKSSIARTLPRTEPLTFDLPPVRDP